MMQMSSLKKIGKPVLKFGLPVIILIWFLYQIKENWVQLTSHTFQWNPWLLALAFFGFMLQELSFGLIWQKVLARLGARLDLRASLRIYLASEFVRYIPGNVWHVLTRVLWAGKYGISRPIAFTSMMIELITKLAAGALVFALSLFFWGDIGAVGSLLAQKLVVGLGALTIFALLVVLHPRVLGGLLNFALRIVRREPVLLTVRYRDILIITLYWCISWLVAGSAFYILVLALWPEIPLSALPICIGICALAWDIGFVSFITPSGLGFREGAVVGLFALSLVLPIGLGTVIALLWRFVSTLAELLCVSIAYLSGGRQVRTLQQEEESRANTSVSSIDSKTNVEGENEEATTISVERGGMSE